MKIQILSAAIGGTSAGEASGGVILSSGNNQEIVAPGTDRKLDNVNNALKAAGGIAINTNQTCGSSFDFWWQYIGQVSEVLIYVIGIMLLTIVVSSF